MKYLIIGDMHLRDRMGYADYIADGRLAEKQAVLDFIFKLSKGCQKVIFLGDQLNGRNNPSTVIKEFIQFIERFKQDVYILAGNHEKVGDGKSAIDFMKEVKNKKWHIITNQVSKIDDDVFCPFFYKGELECATNEQATERLLELLPKGKNLFIHHAATGYGFKSIVTDDLAEIVLPSKELTKRYEKIFCGHIHVKSDVQSKDRLPKIIYTGSVFTNEVNEGKKSVWILEDGKVKEYELPVREIVKLENPLITNLQKYQKNTIVKVILTEATNKYLELVKENLEKCDGSILVEDYKTERKIVKFDDGDLDLDIMNLMKIYAEAKKLDFKKLEAGYELIK